MNIKMNYKFNSHNVKNKNFTCLIDLLEQGNFVLDRLSDIPKEKERKNLIKIK